MLLLCIHDSLNSGAREQHGVNVTEVMVQRTRMNIDDVEFFYLKIPEVLDIGDGSQDALLVRVRAGEHCGWGECEAAPLVSIASWSCPMSHSACKPVSASVLGERLESVEDIHRIHKQVRANSMDLLQADHTLSGIDVALWDLLGKRLKTPVYRLLGYDHAFPKVAYASQLFGDDPQTTLSRALKVREDGFLAAKFGWGPFGQGTVDQDEEQLRAAREGLGEDGILLVDAGTAWGDNIEQAQLRVPLLESAGALWLEEPFESSALGAYRTLARRADKVSLAGGEGCHNFHQAKNMIDFSGLGYIQIDTGRIGGITAAKQVADYAREKGVTFVNHTFTTHLALSASIQPFAGIEKDSLCEYPADPSALARDFSKTPLSPDESGKIHLPEAPGLGVDPDLDTIKKYLVEVEIQVEGEPIYKTPSLAD